MSKAKELLDEAVGEVEAVLDHFTNGEPGLYSHEDAKARAAAYVPPDPPEADAATEAPENPGPPDSPAGPDVKE